MISIFHRQCPDAVDQNLNFHFAKAKKAKIRKFEKLQ